MHPAASSSKIFQSQNESGADGRADAQTLENPPRGENALKSLPAATLADDDHPPTPSASPSAAGGCC